MVAPFMKNYKSNYTNKIIDLFINTNENFIINKLANKIVTSKDTTPVPPLANTKPFMLKHPLWWSILAVILQNDETTIQSKSFPQT